MADQIGTVRVERVHKDIFGANLFAKSSFNQQALRGSILGTISRLAEEPPVEKDGPDRWKYLTSQPDENGKVIRTPFYKFGVTPEERLAALKQLWFWLNPYRAHKDAAPLLSAIEAELLESDANAVVAMQETARLQAEKEAKAAADREIERAAREKRLRDREEAAEKARKTEEEKRKTPAVETSTGLIKLEDCIAQGKHLTQIDDMDCCFFCGVPKDDVDGNVEDDDEDDAPAPNEEPPADDPEDEDEPEEDKPEETVLPATFEALVDGRTECAPAPASESVCVRCGVVCEGNGCIEIDNSSFCPKCAKEWKGEK